MNVYSQSVKENQLPHVFGNDWGLFIELDPYSVTEYNNNKINQCKKTNSPNYNNNHLFLNYSLQMQMHTRKHVNVYIDLEKNLLRANEYNFNGNVNVNNSQINSRFYYYCILFANVGLCLLIYDILHYVFL